MAARRVTCMGDFQFRRTSFVPSGARADPTQKRKQRRPTTQLADTVWDVDENKPTTSAPPATPVPVEQGQVQPKRKRRKKNVPVLDLIDPSLPEEKRLMIAIERSLKLEYEKKYANAAASEREEFEESVLRIMDHLQTLVKLREESPQSSTEHKPNPANEELAKREAQLKAIVASYEKELTQWEAILGSAEQAEIRAAEVPEAPKRRSETVRDVDEVLASSTKAVESFILQTDHVHAVLKQLESRNRATKTRVREIAAKLNDRVMVEFGSANVSDLIPPAGLTAVETNDLTVVASDV